MSQLWFDAVNLNFDVATLKTMSLLESRHSDAMPRLCKECCDIENLMSRHQENFRVDVTTWEWCRDIEMNFPLYDFCLFFAILFIQAYLIREIFSKLFTYISMKCRFLSQKFTAI